MFEVFKLKPSILRDAGNAKFQPRFIFQVLLFAAVFLVSNLVSLIPVVIMVIVKMSKDAGNGVINMSDPSTMGPEYLSGLESGLLLAMLLVTGITTLVGIGYCKFIERRSLYSMGLVKRKAATDYLIGLGIGLLMFSACVLIANMMGTLSFSGIILGSNLGLLTAFFCGFVLQGMSEEVLLRGYFMISVANKKPIVVAIITNSIVFALIHSLNDGISPLAMGNLFLFGVFASVYTLKADSLWGICAIHTIWNFAQGNIFGIAVSGIDISTSIFKFTPTPAGVLINGGSFGLEGGLAVTIVLVISIGVTLYVKGRNTEVEPILVDESAAEAV